MSEMSDMGRMKETILEEYPRLGAEDAFRFSCGKNTSCFTNCCGDVNIVLTPYCILRMARRLKMDTEAFLDKHCIIPFSKEQRMPVILLRMEDNEKKTCPFVDENGCGIYEDRPWACRMYPVGAASPKDDKEKPFYFLMKEDPCNGFAENEGKEWTIRSWMENQGVAEYDAMGEEFKEITLHDAFLKGKRKLDPAKMEQFFMACYNLDKFRRFVFESTFLNRFEVPDMDVEKARTDDLALMRLGFKWVRFAIFGEKTIKILETVRQKWEEGMDPAKGNGKPSPQ